MNAIAKRIGPFHHCGDLFPRLAGGKKYIVGFATAYNAFGLIGPELNGIFVLNDTDKDVVLDQHMKTDTGYFGAKPQHLAELKRLKDLSDEDFLTWIAGHPRARDQYRR